MDAHSAELLDLPALRERLAGHAAFAGGRALALVLMPSSDPAEVARRRGETEEALALQAAGLSPPGGAHDVRPPARAAARGAALEVAELEEVLVTAEVALEVRQAVAAHEDVAPALAARLGEVDHGALARVVAALEVALDRRGGLRDGASPDLGRLRREVAAARRAAVDTLGQVASRLRSHLQETFTTERGGRPVLAVKASSRSAVPGLVHDASGSGQTLFIEPFEVLEANNRVRELAAAEREEAERVLAELSREVGEREPALAGAVDALSDLDLALARAGLSRAWDGCLVEPSDEVWLAGARHPLLDPATAVPIDLDLRGLRCLVVSGPNTGGKTVAMKTLGLLALLHQSGLRVPARVARLPVFDAVLADIGDEQSIARSLSTFSAHVRALVGILAAAGPRTLVLLDEIGAGTDPVEGGALARAALERLAAQGALVLTTTHHPELKDWAAATPGAANGAVGFDPRTLAPAYELHIGEPGASHALAIAERLGLPAAVVAAARAGVDPDRRAAEGLLLEASAARAAAGDALEEARAELARAGDARREAERRGAELEERLERQRAEAAAERARARHDAERELADAQRALRDLRAEVAAARRAEGARARAAGGAAAAGESERDRRLGAASAAAARATSALAGPAPAAPAAPLRVGDRVFDPALGVRGLITALQGREAEVQGPSARLRVPVARLVADRSAPEPPSSPRPGVRVELRPDRDAASPEVDVRGRRAEEARAAVRERVDAAVLAGLSQVRVVHGHGTGALRAAVRDELERHPLVDRAAPAPPDQGGDGATLVYLSEAEGA